MLSIPPFQPLPDPAPSAAAAKPSLFSKDLFACPKGVLETNETIPHWLNQVQNPVWVSSSQRRFEFFNHAWLQFTGRGLEQEVGFGWLDRVHPDDIHFCWEAHASALEEPKEFTIEFRLKRADGQFRWIKTTGVPRFDDKNRLIGHIGTAQDVTEFKTTEAQKLECYGRLAGGLAHEFNNLLTGIIGYSSLGQMDVDEGHPVKEYLDQIESAAAKAAERCREILLLSGKGNLRFTPINLSTTVKKLIDQERSSIPISIYVHFDADEDLSPIQGDLFCIQSAAAHLLHNAIDSIQAPSGNIRIAVGRLHADRGFLSQCLFAQGLPQGNYQFIEIADNGTGIPGEIQQKIFDPFFSTKFRSSSHGLGLTTVAGIMQSHQGTIRFFSRPNQGSSFMLLFQERPSPSSAASM